MQVDEQDALQAKITKLEKRLKAAESQCQATTKEIWQMEVDLGRWEERAKEAEEKLAQLESQGTPQADSSALDALRQELEAVQSKVQADRLAWDELRSAHEVTLAEMRMRLQEAEQEVRAAQESSGQLEELQQRLREMEERAQGVEESLQARLQEARQQTEELEQQLSELRTGKEEGLQERLRELEQRLSEADIGKDEELARLRVAAVEAEQRADLAELDRETLTEVRSNLESQLQDLEQQMQNLRFVSEEGERQLKEAEERVASLQLELASARQTGGGSGLEVQRLQDTLQLQQEKTALLQQRLEQLQQRLELSDEKAQMYQNRLAEQDARFQEATQRALQAEEEARQAREQLQRVSSRVDETDRVRALAEQKIQEADQKHQESWQRVREAETKANQLMVENKRLTDRLGEHERRAQESDRETQRLAFQDSLTGLPNLNLMTQYLEFSCKQCMRYRRVAALLMIDIDRFKVFNEAMGTKAGDELLARVAERLQQAIRDTDSLGRKGEDEFIILLSELNVGDHGHADARIRAIRQHVEVVANRVMQIMGPPFTVQGQKFYLHVSIGIAICPDDGETPQALLENADTAMYHVKDTGRNRYQFYTADLRRQQEKRLSLDMQMRSALERNEFEVRYHPVISLSKGKGMMVGVEALLRWNHRMEGTVGPEFFLAGAEESGMIIPLGQWVLSQVCNQMRDWLSQGLRIFASVNLSKRQLLQADLVEVIGRELSTNGIPPEVLYVEIAEGFNTFNPEMMDQVINRLGQAGIRIAIDDFGVGYSNLSHVNLNYTRVLKIDRSIIDKCPNDRQSATVCIAAINLASSLGLLSLAEGVENANQVKFLSKYGCALAQGYYFTEPVSFQEITNYHRTKKVWKV